MDVASEKRRLRRRVRSRILALDPAERSRQEASLSDRLASLPGFSEAATVLLYVSAFPEEWDTGPALHLALDSGKRLILPRVDRVEGRLRLYHVSDLANDLVPGTLSIPEPRLDLPQEDSKGIDWVLVPGLAFDEEGHRVGRGAGHYDRLLPTLRVDAPRWALIFDVQWVERLPAEPHDQPLDGVESPSRRVVRSR